MEKKVKNVYFITSIFPNFDSNNILYGTTFLYKYSKEIKKLGHNVTVVHMSRSYPVIFNYIAKLLSVFGIHKYEKFIIPNDVQSDSEYLYDGIQIYRYNYKKYFPHSLLGKRQTLTAANKIKELIKINGKPDVIIGDFLDCGLPIIYELDKTIKCTKMQIIHNSDYTYMQRKKLKQKFKIVDKWLFRSNSQKKKLDKYLSNYSFDYMYSGVEDGALSKFPIYRENIKNLLYVGKLIKLKGLDTVLYAIANSTDEKLNLKVLGSGTDEKYYKELVEKLNISSKVTFVGQVEHSEVYNYMDNADAMILISHETFGMVYIEAMSRGCIPIGAIDEGIDGVVKNGYNGFLVHYGNSDELLKIINNSNKMSSKEISQISKNAYNTAKNMTDEMLAIRFMKMIKKR